MADEDSEATVNIYATYLVYKDRETCPDLAAFSTAEGIATWTGETEVSDYASQGFASAFGWLRAHLIAPESPPGEGFRVYELDAPSIWSDQPGAHALANFDQNWGLFAHSTFPDDGSIKLYLLVVSHAYAENPGPLGHAKAYCLDRLDVTGFAASGQ
jgi:hypothetical protein